MFNGFNRVLAYTKFGADVIDRTCGWMEGTTPYLPHGTDKTVFFPRDRKEARDFFIEKVVQKGKGIITGDILLAAVWQRTLHGKIGVGVRDLRRTPEARIKCRPLGAHGQISKGSSVGLVGAGR